MNKIESENCPILRQGEVKINFLASNYFLLTTIIEIKDDQNQELLGASYHFLCTEMQQLFGTNKFTVTIELLNYQVKEVLFVIQQKHDSFSKFLYFPPLFPSP